MGSPALKAQRARCDECPLRDKPPVPPRPASSPLRLVLVSDSPGRADERSGAPLSGAGGSLLKLELGHRGLPWEACHVTHAIACRPESDKQAEKASACCAPRLLRELGALPGAAPILSLGKDATRVLVGAKKVGVLRGFVWEAREGAKVGKKAALTLKGETALLRNALAGRRILPTLSLSFIVNAHAWISLFRIDLSRAVRAANGAPAHEEGGAPDAINADPWAVWHAIGRPTRVTCDIETDGIDPRVCGITCIGLAEVGGARKVGVVWPWRDTAAVAMSTVLRPLAQVVFHNGYGFDLLVMRAHGISW